MDMNLEQLTNHLFNSHKRVIDVMTPVVGFSLPPLKIIVRPLLVEAAICRGGPIYISSNENGEDYSQAEIIYKEFGVAHETGHYFNFQNPRNLIDKDPRKDSKRTLRENRIINYRELAAEFFALCYFDIDQRFPLVKDIFEEHSDVLELYSLKTTPEERREVCRWLIKNSYDEVKRKFRNGPLKHDFRRLVMEV